MHCDYEVWRNRQHSSEQSKDLGEGNCRCNSKRHPLICRQPAACGVPGSLYIVSGQTGDLFKFEARGVSAPVTAVLCAEHASKLEAQGLHVVMAGHDLPADRLAGQLVREEALSV